jgi:hypothetical protein
MDFEKQHEGKYLGPSWDTDPTKDFFPV